MKRWARSGSPAGKPGSAWRPRHVTVRGTWFDNRVKNPVANVSTSTNGNTRQVRNLGSTNIAGFQTDVAYRVNASLTASAAYVFDIAKVHESVPDSSGVDLTGKFLAEVPKNRGSVQVSYSNPKYVNVALAVQIVGMQFDDDQNVMKILPLVTDKAKVGLPAYGVTDLTASRTINRQRGRLLRRAEPVRHGVLRGDEPDDHRHAAPRQRRHPPQSRTINSLSQHGGTETRGCVSKQILCVFVSPCCK